MAEFEDITYQTDGAVCRITLARPEKLNAYRDETADELTSALRKAEADASLRVVVLTGQGRAFGAGYDLATVDPSSTPALERVLEEHFNPLVHAMRQSRLPIISVVNGPCAGAAVGLALAGDIVLAARSAYFYEPFLNIALVPDAGNTIFLTRMLGRVRASGMMLLGDRISAEQALEWGLVWKVFDDGDLEAEAQKVAAKLAGLSATGIASTKRLITQAAEADLDALLALERDLQGEAGRSPDFTSAVAAFFASRKR
ncbi:enoyl-CoA hydratase-related protein [Tianweitania sediminis]|uniref:Enoyl-CoA hydratase/isomerase family protein n=1 Tax=Tianweitania sediminis TaxID=1502156 RepID=A0A8J7R3J9_9HYPH|nr:enoyl-CoA hydratase-related protein [Tianweitania sediminis]MBP0439891.1 enoyl-CoA hydratase/isomerase family protein [Tianweitania sediminis]